MLDSRSIDIIYRWMTLTVIHSYPDSRITDVYKDLKFHEIKNISTDDGPSANGYKFTHWQINEGHANISDIYSTSTDIEMLYDNVIVEAIYKKMYYLTVINGITSGWYDPLERIYVVADSDPIGQYFHHWYGGDYQDSFEDFLARDTYFHMPYDNCTIEAIYRWYYFILEVQFGTGDGEYHYSESINISADNKFDEGFEFDHWNIESVTNPPPGQTVIPGTFDNANSANTIFHMSLGDTVIRAYYHWIMWTLYVRADGKSIIGQSGFDTYSLHKSQTQNISARNILPTDGQDFDHWAIDDKDENTPNDSLGTGIMPVGEDPYQIHEETVIDRESANTIWKHGNRDFHLKAVYIWHYWDFSVRNDGENNIIHYSLHKGQTQTIQAIDRLQNSPDYYDGYDFDHWAEDDGNDPLSGGDTIPSSPSPDEEHVINTYAMNTTWRHGNRDFAIKAVYKWHKWHLYLETPVLAPNGVDVNYQTTDYLLHKSEFQNILTSQNISHYDFDSWHFSDHTQNPLTPNDSGSLVPNGTSDAHVLDNSSYQTIWYHGNDNYFVKAVYVEHHYNFYVRKDGENDIVNYNLIYNQGQTIEAIYRLDTDGYDFKQWEWDNGSTDPFVGNGTSNLEGNDPDHIQDIDSRITSWIQGLIEDRFVKAVYEWHPWNLAVRRDGENDIVNYTLHKGETHNIQAIDRYNNPPDYVDGYQFLRWEYDVGDNNPLSTHDDKIIPEYNPSATPPIVERCVINNTSSFTTWYHGNQNDIIKAVYKEATFHLNVRKDGQTSVVTYDLHKTNTQDVIADNLLYSQGLDFYRWEWDDGETDQPTHGNGIENLYGPGENQLSNVSGRQATWKQGFDDHSIKAVYSWHEWILDVRDNGMTHISHYDPTIDETQNIEAYDLLDSYGYDFKHWEWDDGETDKPFEGGGTLNLYGSGYNQLSNVSGRHATWLQGTHDHYLKAVYQWHYWTLEVYNGYINITGHPTSGDYHKGEAVSIHGEYGNPDYEFDHWEFTVPDPDAGQQIPESDQSDPGHVSSQSESTTFYMTNRDAYIKAIYVEVIFHLTVENGTGDGDYHEGDGADVEADDAPTGMTFNYWGKKIATNTYEYIDVGTSPGQISSQTSNATYYMPAEDTTIKAFYKYINYTLTVKDGSGDTTTAHYKNEINIDLDDTYSSDEFWIWLWNNTDFDDVDQCASENDVRCLVYSNTTKENKFRMGAQSDTIRAGHKAEWKSLGFSSEKNSFTDDGSGDWSYTAARPTIVADSDIGTYVCTVAQGYSTSSNPRKIPPSIYNDCDLTIDHCYNGFNSNTSHDFWEKFGTDRIVKHSNFDLDLDDDDTYDWHSDVYDPGSDYNVVYTNDNLKINAYSKYKLELDIRFIALQEAGSGAHWDGFLIKYKNADNEWKDLLYYEKQTGGGTIYMRKWTYIFDLEEHDTIKGLAACVLSPSESLNVRYRVYYSQEA